MTSRQISSDSEEVRRSLDVLDRVLSEFDDIDQSSSVNSLTEAEEEKGKGPKSAPPTENNPPPIDRTLKPKISPPALPKKSRRVPSPPPRPKTPEKVPVDFPFGTQNSKKSISDVSSHEYQEINSDLLGPSHFRDQQRHESLERTLPPRHRSQESLMKGEVGHPRGRGRITNSPGGSRLRKSRSGEVTLPDENSARGRKHSRRQGAPRRSRSSDRILDPRSSIGSPQPYPLSNRPFDPRMINPSLIDPRFMVHPRLGADPRFLAPRGPLPPQQMHSLEPSGVIPDHRFPIEGTRYVLDDPVHFPHLLNLQNSVHLPARSIHLSPGQVGSPDFSLPPFDYPLLPDTFLPEFGGLPGASPFHPAMDPRLLPPSSLGFIPEIPFEVPLQFANDIHPDFPLRERLDYKRSGPKTWEKRLLEDTPVIGPDWYPQTIEEARAMEFMMGQHPPMDISTEEELARQDARIAMQRGMRNSRRLTSTGHSDSSGRSSPNDDMPKRGRAALKTRSGQKGYPTVQSFLSGTVPGTRPATFRLGEAVRDGSDISSSDVAQGKGISSLPHFPSGGKDSGFDESPIPEDVSKNLAGGRANVNPGGVGGGFIVSGVFSDSSKMYIPAPPSPTPDYDDDEINDDSDGAESDILHGALYTINDDTKKTTVTEQNKPIKTSASNVSVNGKAANRDSISDDSLQGDKKSCKSKSLATMMSEFHMGLPPPHLDEGPYSDDSLEESSMVFPSRPSTMDLRNQRPQSVESLVSMGSSIASFDYMSGSKSLSPSKIKSRHSFDNHSRQSNVQNNSFNQSKVTSNNDNENTNSNIPIPPPISYDIRFPSTKSNKKTKIMETRLYGATQPDSSAVKSNTDGKATKFDTIRNLMKDGLIEGLDDVPPDFKPPPIIQKALHTASSEERTDSGMGSTVSTNRTDESGGSDNHSDKSISPPSSKSVSSSAADNHRREEISNIDNVNNNEFSSNKNAQDRRPRSPAPPPPPPRDSSMKSAVSQKNSSWLHKQKRPAPTVPLHHHPNTNPVTHNANDKDDRLNEVLLLKHSNYNAQVCERIINNSISNHRPKEPKMKTAPDRDLLENLKNLDSSRNLRPDSLPMISEDQGSVSSHGSRTGRFFSRLSDSMKSGSRASVASSRGSGSSRTGLSKSNSSKASPRIHGDIIRGPNKNSLKPVISPPDLPTIVSPSTVVPFTRDGSGRFRSIEDLAEESSGKKTNTNPCGGGNSNLDHRKKKNATLPPNMNPAYPEMVLEMGKGKSTFPSDPMPVRDEPDNSKFRFNIFKGFWRRNKYSFDKV